MKASKGKSLFRSPLLFVPLLLSAGGAEARLEAHFRVTALDGGCLVDSQEGFGQGDPERYFRMAIFDDSNLGILSACANGCIADTIPATEEGASKDFCAWSEGCGFWNFPDQELVKVIPNQSSVYFYFGLFDEDTDDDDGLGDHWFFVDGTESGSGILNNGVSPYYVGHGLNTVCSRFLEGVGDAGNYRLSFTGWIEDTDGPILAGPPSHVDASLGDPAWNDDDTLRFEWSPAEDPHSGITGYTFSLVDTTSDTILALQQPAGIGGVTICPAGCDFDLTPENGHVYAFQYRARNGLYPNILNPSTATSSPVYVRQLYEATDVASREDVPSTAALFAPSPTPFLHSVRIDYALPRPGPVEIGVFDVRGRLLEIAVSDAAHPAGRFAFEWDGRTTTGEIAPAGVYFVRLRSGTFTETRKVTRLR